MANIADIPVFENAIVMLQNFGFFQVVLPFLLVFAVLYGILSKSAIFGDPADKENVRTINAIIAFVGGFIVVTATPVVEAINNLVPQASFLLIILLLMMLSMAFFGINVAGLESERKWWKWIPAIILAVIFLGIVDTSTGFQIPVIHDLVLGLMGQNIEAIPEETMATITSLFIMLVIPIAVIYFMVRKEKST